jgi:hypothetical protein
MARYFAWVPVKWGNTSNTFKVELEAADTLTAEDLEKIRSTAKAHVRSRGMEVAERPGENVQVTRKP